MSHTPHTLAEEFPAYASKIHALRASDAHFARIHAAYDEVNTAVSHAESRIMPTDDAHLEQLRRQRMKLKDDIWLMLRNA